MLTIPQLEELIKLVADDTVESTVITKIAQGINLHRSLFKHGDIEIKLFIGMSAHETQKFKEFEEKSYKSNEKADEDYFEGKYGYKTSKGKNELGNTEKGDGSKFRGRGMLHITGRAFYQVYSKRIGKETEVMGNPKLMKDDKDIAVLTSILYWVDKVQAHLGFACTNEDLFVEALRGVNKPELKDLVQMGKRREKVMEVIGHVLRISNTSSSDAKDFLDVYLLPLITDDVSGQAPLEIDHPHVHMDWCAVTSRSQVVMSILIKRLKAGTKVKEKKKDNTRIQRHRVLGELYVDGEFVCYTLESVVDPDPFVSSGNYVGTWELDRRTNDWSINLRIQGDAHVSKRYIGKPGPAETAGLIQVGFVGRVFIKQKNKKNEIIKAYFESEDSLIHGDIVMLKIHQYYMSNKKAKPGEEKKITVTIQDAF